MILVVIAVSISKQSKLMVVMRLLMVLRVKMQMVLGRLSDRSLRYKSKKPSNYSAFFVPSSVSITIVCLLSPNIPPPIPAAIFGAALGDAGSFVTEAFGVWISFSKRLLSENTS